MNPSVSVVIPAYNAAGHLPAAIQSVREQKWPQVEIIVVDDGSYDETSGVLTGLASDDLRVFTQSNAGPAAARNRGIAEARGFWIAFLDADDTWLGAKLKSQMDALSGDPSSAFCYADVLLCDGESNERIQSPYLLCGQLFLGLLLGPQLAMGTVVVRRDCFNRLGTFDTQLRTGEDWDMWLRLAGEYSGVYVPATLLRVDRKRENLTKYSTGLLERCTLRVLERLFARTETTIRWPKVALQKRQLYAWHYSVLAKSHLKRGQPMDFCRLAIASLAAHPRGFFFLARRWSRGAGRPIFKGLD